MESFFETLSVVRELRQKLDYMTQILEQLHEKVETIVQGLTEKPMHTSDSSGSKSPSPLGRFFPALKPD